MVIKTICFRLHNEYAMHLFEQFIKVLKNEYGEGYKMQMSIILVTLIEGWLKRYWKEKEFERRLEEQKTLLQWGIK